jgi:uncharacterized integral membrane protein
MGKLRTLLGFILIVITMVTIAIFSIQNIEMVTVQWLTFTSIEITSGLIMVASFGVGLLLSVLLWETKTLEPKVIKSKKKARPPRSAPAPTMDYASMRDKINRSDKEQQYDWSDPASKEW